ncbi:MAG TPA: plastocyanin/azurin family copper-binding protein [Longimicrobiales bacterium]|nr:plastocyanin/azurin family copper-binding protein [Longimicrobiales bacterium]
MKRIAFIAAVLLTACVSEAPEPTDPGTGDVTIDMTSQLTFAPAAAQARVGQTVVWENESSMAHTVTADPALAGNPASVSLPAGAAPFASPLIGAGASFSHTFTVPGTYRYFCQPHEGAGMIGTIVVVP